MWYLIVSIPDLSTLTYVETVSEDEYSNFKRLKMVSETKLFESFSNVFFLRDAFFLLEPIRNCTYIITIVPLENKAIYLNI